jgi:amino acid adenylation domain-containing protein
MNGLVKVKQKRRLPFDPSTIVLGDSAIGTTLEGIMDDFNIVSSLHRMASCRADAPCIVTATGTFTYGQLADKASRLAALFARSPKTRRIGLLASRSPAAYAGLAGAAWAGAAYVPLNLKWPPERLIALMSSLELDALVVDKNGAELLTPDVRDAAPRLIIAADDAAPVDGAVRLADLPDARMEQPARTADTDPAYVLFTSGTTGMPKGVMVSAGSLARYLEQTRGWAGFTPDDRVAEAHDLTFDLSVHNLFLALEAGSALHVMSPLDMMAPQRFIRSNAITCWMSVPTIITMMKANGALKPGVFPSLRLSVFCGEPLPMPAVEAWADAASNSVIENIYGPTECTVVCMRQRLTPDAPVTPRRNILAIGTPYANFEIGIFDAAQNPLPQGDIGEIALKSPQLSDGYFNSPEQTARAFRMVRGERWYLTGDLGYQDTDGVFHHMGRADNQVKLKGNRIELDEVDMHLRAASGTDLACTVAWPVIDGSAQGLVGFTTNAAVSPEAVIEAMLEKLPRYMVPARILHIHALPQNVNGKTDRKALAAMLENEVAETAMVPA